MILNVFGGVEISRSTFNSIEISLWNKTVQIPNIFVRVTYFISSKDAFSSHPVPGTATWRVSAKQQCLTTSVCSSSTHYPCHHNCTSLFIPFNGSSLGYKTWGEKEGAEKRRGGKKKGGKKEGGEKRRGGKKKGGKGKREKEERKEGGKLVNFTVTSQHWKTFALQSCKKLSSCWCVNKPEMILALEKRIQNMLLCCHPLKKWKESLSHIALSSNWCLLYGHSFKEQMTGTVYFST